MRNCKEHENCKEHRTMMAFDEAAAPIEASSSSRFELAASLLELGEFRLAKEERGEEKEVEGGALGTPLTTTPRGAARPHRKRKEVRWSSTARTLTVPIPPIIMNVGVGVFSNFTPDKTDLSSFVPRRVLPNRRPSSQACSRHRPPCSSKTSALPSPRPPPPCSSRRAFCRQQRMRVLVVTPPVGE